ncbi:MAG TPA: methyltransferase domain-containing protein [Longimicrobiales bacterium]|nr:methyltransferase domain-containing protein [Longimicrobiales bacterium]
MRQKLWRVAEIAWCKAGRWLVQCPVCGWRFRSFRPAGVVARRNARCPQCGSLERHRLQWLFLVARTDLFTRPRRVLHFAPESCLRNRLLASGSIEYLSVDLDGTDVSIRCDITALPFASGAFDVILCSHVLEHVSDDVAALEELYRVLSDSGWAMLQVPIDPTRARTFEDPRVREPSERERLFGQADHMRAYGSDYPDRLRRAGFHVRTDRFADEQPPALLALHAIEPEPIFVVGKPRRES